MSDDRVMVSISGDSGPYGSYWRSDKTEEWCSSQMLEGTVLVPRALIEEYERVSARKDELEEEMNRLIQAVGQKLPT